ncbi:MAG: NAD-dependent epimerase/dehydratase family protein [Egibacteraceae bacterium]
MRSQQGRRVLITGIAGQLGGQLAARLEADDDVAYLAGLDLHEPRHDLTRTEYVRADLRSPLVAKLVEDARVDTIVHLDITATPADAGGRTRMKERNVLGTMQLLGAAQRCPGVARVVVKSTTAVYGSTYTNPALLREESAPDAAVHRGYGKDAVEVESYARAFGRRRADVALTVLRFANFIGPNAQTPLTRYLALPAVPTVLGFDPRVQLCHETDAVEVLYRAARGDHPGIFNVAGPGIVYLSQAIRLAGRVSVPVPPPFVGGVAGLVRRAGRIDVTPDQLAFLTYGRVADISRLREHFGYEPAYSTRAALADFLASGRVSPVVDPETLTRVEQRVHGLLTRTAARGSAT